MSGPVFAFAPARASDLEALTELRLRVMAESFNRIGRFDPELSLIHI